MPRAARFALGPGLLFALVLGCASKRPVLYPNDRLRQTDVEVVDADVARCLRLASEYGLGKNPAGEVAEDTAKSGATGGAAGAAAGAVWGHAGRGAAAGAAGAGAAGFVRSLFGARDPDPVYKRFVERCLHEQGYETIGWR
jgi:hypothetical protein